MAHPLEHAKNSARRFGGVPNDYLPIHNWFDESKAIMADVRHRALRHHAEGIFLAERIFGAAIRNSEGKDGFVIDSRVRSGMAGTAITYTVS